MDLNLRPATRDDSPAIAELFQMAAGGVADYIWQSVAEPGETLLQTGARRFAREGEDFSFENCVMAESDGAVAGMMCSYRMDEVSEIDDDLDPILLPYCELEFAPSLYVAGIACYPERRGEGIGSVLIDHADEKAEAMGLEDLSLIAFEENAGSVRLYERLGYRTRDRRAIVPHELIQYSGDALLMVRAL